MRTRSGRKRALGTRAPMAIQQGANLRRSMAAAITTVRIVTITVAIASCLSPFTTYVNLADRQSQQLSFSADTFDSAAKVSARSANLSNPLDPYTTLRSSDVDTLPSAEGSIQPVTRHVSADQTDVKLATQTDAKIATHERVAFRSLPRGLEKSFDRISFDTPTLAPMSFVRFCIQYPRDCEVRRMAFRGRPVMLSKTRMAELMEVNDEVNQAIRPELDPSGVGGEEWRISPREGDCKDYAVTKRHMLLARGWPSRSLLLAEVVVRSGEHHVVLVVRTHEEDLVLDNLSRNIRSSSQIRYQWVRGQQADNPKFWSTISVGRGVRVAMSVR